LAKTILESVEADYEIIQLAEKEMEFCNLCEKCASDECVLEDDFNQIFEKMKSADGIIFAVPKYIFLASKFLCFLERLDSIRHMRRYAGYKINFKNPDYGLFTEKNLFAFLPCQGRERLKKKLCKWLWIV